MGKKGKQKKSRNLHSEATASPPNNKNQEEEIKISKSITVKKSPEPVSKSLKPKEATTLENNKLAKAANADFASYSEKDSSKEERENSLTTTKTEANENLVESNSKQEHNNENETEIMKSSKFITVEESPKIISKFLEPKKPEGKSLALEQEEVIEIDSLTNKVAEPKSSALEKTIIEPEEALRAKEPERTNSNTSDKDFFSDSLATEKFKDSSVVKVENPCAIPKENKLQKIINVHIEEPSDTISKSSEVEKPQKAISEYITKCETVWCTSDPELWNVEKIDSLTLRATKPLNLKGSDMKKIRKAKFAFAPPFVLPTRNITEPKRILKKSNIGKISKTAQIYKESQPEIKKNNGDISNEQKTKEIDKNSEEKFERLTKEREKPKPDTENLIKTSESTADNPISKSVKSNPFGDLDLIKEFVPRYRETTNNNFPDYCGQGAIRKKLLINTKTAKTEIIESEIHQQGPKIVKDQINIKGTLKETSGIINDPTNTGKLVLKDKHPLKTTWTLWFYQKKTGFWINDLKQITTFDTAVDFWLLFNHLKLPSELPDGCNYCLFRTGIKPAWEDKKNMFGGKWSISFDPSRRREDLDNIWMNTMLFTLLDATPESLDICGVVVSVRNIADKIDLWTQNCQDPRTNINIGRMFKQRLGIRNDIMMSYHVHAEAKYFPKKYIHLI